LVTILLKEAISYYQSSARIGSWQLVTCSVLFNLAKTALTIFTRRNQIEMLSRDCDGCPHMRACSVRFAHAKKGEKVYCPDGTVHLID